MTLLYLLPRVEAVARRWNLSSWEMAYVIMGTSSPEESAQVISDIYEKILTQYDPSFVIENPMDTWYISQLEKYLDLAFVRMP
jgi:hypothetical protein